MRFRLHCANPRSGEEFEWEVDTPTIQDAERRGHESGLLISEVRPVSDCRRRWIKQAAAALFGFAAGVAATVAWVASFQPDALVAGEVREAEPDAAANADVVERLAASNSTPEHWMNMYQMGQQMVALGYDISLPELPAALLGVRHISAPVGSSLYQIEWRLVGTSPLADSPNDVPVSFLSVEYEGPFTHDMAAAAVTEFYRIDVAVGSDRVRDAMREAEHLMAEAKAASPDTMGGWHIKTSTPATFATDDPGGDYIVRVDVHERPVEEYTLETGWSRVIVYFPYFPPDREVRLSDVHGSGF